MGRVLGVLGGMGPLASAHFMTRLTLLTPAERDQDHVPAILWSDPRVPNRWMGPYGAGPQPLPFLVRGLRGLAAAGCGAIAIPCNTAHGWIDGMRAATTLPILHIVDAAADELRRQGIPPGAVGLLGTGATLELRLYQDPLATAGWPCIEPTPDEMQHLVMPAIAAVKANRAGDAYALLAKAILALQARGAQAMVLACTEIPLGIQAGPHGGLGVPLIDTIDALARASIAWSRETGPVISP